MRPMFGDVSDALCDRSLRPRAVRKLHKKSRRMPCLCGKDRWPLQNIFVRLSLFGTVLTHTRPMKVEGGPMETESDSDRSASWDGSGSDDDAPDAKCLFCHRALGHGIWDHMIAEYDFDMARVRTGFAEFGDLERTRLINFLRRRQMDGHPASREELAALGPASDIWKDDSLLLASTMDDRLLWDIPQGFGSASGSDSEGGATRPGPAATRPRPRPRRCGRRYFATYSRPDIHREMIGDRRRTLAYKEFILGHRGLFEGKVVLDVGCGTGILSHYCLAAGATAVIGIDAAGPVIDIAHAVAARNGTTTPPLFLLKAEVEKTCIVVRWKADRSGLEEARALKLGEAVPNGFTSLECDVIVSEWMGYALFFESMLHSVLNARDRYLCSGGVMAPSRVAIWASAVDDRAALTRTMLQWKSGPSRATYGLDLSPIAPDEAQKLTDAEVAVVTPCMLRSLPSRLGTLDLLRCTRSELNSLQFGLDLRLDFGLKTEMKRIFGPACCLQCAAAFRPTGVPASTVSLDVSEWTSADLETLPPSDHAATSMAIWFDAHFDVDPIRCPGGAQSRQTVTLSTSPLSPPTHWAQTILHFRSAGNQAVQFVEEGRITGALDVSRHPDNPRSLLLMLEVRECPPPEALTGNDTSRMRAAVKVPFTKLYELL
eukprot:Polyplicarium_translucidae@DN3328_c2_g1_i17.p1